MGRAEAERFDGWSREGHCEEGKHAALSHSSNPAGTGVHDLRHDAFLLTDVQPNARFSGTRSSATAETGGWAALLICRRARARFASMGNARPSWSTADSSVALTSVIKAARASSLALATMAASGVAATYGTTNS